MTHNEQMPNQETNAAQSPGNQTTADLTTPTPPGWIETRRDYKVNEKGEEVLTGITREKTKERVWGFEKRDFIDFALRIFSLLAIFVPILLFYFGQQREANKAKAAANLESYSAIAKDIYTITDPYTSPDSIKHTYENFKFNSFLKAKVYANKELIIKANELKDLISLYIYASSISVAIEKFHQTTTYEFLTLDDQLTFPTYKYTISDSSRVNAIVHLIDSNYNLMYNSLSVEHITRFRSSDNLDTTSLNKDFLSLISEQTGIDTLNSNYLFQLSSAGNVYPTGARTGAEIDMRDRFLSVGRKYYYLSDSLDIARQQHVQKIRQVILEKLDEAQNTITNN